MTHNINNITQDVTLMEISVCLFCSVQSNPDSKVHGANMGPSWVLSAPVGPHIGPMNLAIKEVLAVHCISIIVSLSIPLPDRSFDNTMPNEVSMAHTDDRANHKYYISE